MDDTRSDRKRRRRRPALVWVLGLGLFAAGCHAGEETPGRADASAAPVDDATTHAPPTTPENPLSDYVNVADDPGEVTREREQFRRFEQAIADCMDAQGFTWEPDDDGGGAVSDEHARRADMPRDEFVATYGYGITTIDVPDEPSTGGDPNTARLDAMSVAERTAWHRALLGDGVALDDQGRPSGTGRPGDSPASEDRGCADRAEDAVLGTDATEEPADPDRFAPLIEDVQRLGSRVDGDPRVQEAVRQWRNCMAERGFPDLATPEEPANQVRARLADLGEPPPPDELAALRRRELEVAAADHACSGDLERVRRQVRIETERTFIAENRERLEAFRDARATDGED